ncbi:hypothetical protein A2U01_0072053, partial [Trifolium medium]|nr:hypothetical protein [Trifolium medium]
MTEGNLRQPCGAPELNDSNVESPTPSVSLSVPESNGSSSLLEDKLVVGSA